MITLGDTAAVGDLRREISQKTELPTFDLKSGYPPQPLNLDQFDSELKLVDTGLKLDGEQLIAVRQDIGAVLRHPLTSTEPPPQTGSRLPPLPPSFAAASDAKPSQTAAAPLTLSRKRNDASKDPPEIPLPTSNSTLVLRVMEDDNSCLFRAFSSAVFGQSLDSMYELRSLVASHIQSQPATYSAAVLEKSPDAYCKWIQRDDAWGGAIELGILSQEFNIEICSINVQDLRVDRFNEGQPTRCILVYSGIHYDVVALSPSEPPHTHTDVPPDFDVQVFDSDNDAILVGALELCKVLQQRHYYTDTAGFAVKCNQCGWQGEGEKSATEHAKDTGHMDFGES